MKLFSSSCSTLVGLHKRRMDHQRIDDQNEGCVIESAYDAAYESLGKIHSYNNAECDSLVASCGFLNEVVVRKRVVRCAANASWSRAWKESHRPNDSE